MTDVEEVARSIYDAFERKDNMPKPPWVDGGNSLKQGQARRQAQAALAAAKPIIERELLKRMIRLLRNDPDYDCLCVDGIEDFARDLGYDDIGE